MALFDKQKNKPPGAKHAHRPDGKKFTQMDVKTGTRLTLEVISSTGERVTLYSNYEESIGEDEYVITAPMVSGGIYPLQKGESAKVAYFADGAHYESDAAVGERVTKGGLKYLQMYCAGFVTRVQRRGDFRVKILLEAGILAGDGGGKSIPDKDAKPVTAVINDLSAGGAAMYIPVEIPKGTVVVAKLPEEMFGEPKDMLSEVQWVRRSDNKHAPYKFYMGIRFIFEHAREKEILVRYTLGQQRKQMGKDGGG